MLSRCPAWQRVHSAGIFESFQMISPVLAGKLQKFKCGERVNNTAAIHGECGA
jgi:hypothetical protein